MEVSCQLHERKGINLIFWFYVPGYNCHELRCCPLATLSYQFCLYILYIINGGEIELWEINFKIYVPFLPNIHIAPVYCVPNLFNLKH
jgi:hypothetical protein